MYIKDLFFAQIHCHQNEFLSQNLNHLRFRHTRFHLLHFFVSHWFLTIWACANVSTIKAIGSTSTLLCWGRIVSFCSYMKYFRVRNLVLAFCSSIWFGGPDCFLSIRVQSGSTSVDEFLMTVSIPWRQNSLDQGEVTNNLLLVATFVAQVFSFYHRTSSSELHLQTLFIPLRPYRQQTKSSMTSSQALVSFSSIPIEANAYWNQGKWKQTTTPFIKNVPWKLQQWTN